MNDSGQNDIPDAPRASGLATFALVCFGLGLTLAVVFWAFACRSSGGDLSAAGIALLELTLFHLLVLAGAALGFIARRGSRLAWRALWLNGLLLVAFWTWGLLFSPC